MKYTYTPRRRAMKKTRRIPWVWLLIPALIGTAFFGASLANGGGGASSPACGGSIPCSPTPAILAVSGSPAPDPAPTPFARPRRTAGVSAGGTPPAVATAAAAVAVLEEPCGVLLYGKNADAPLPPASLAKMMTAIVALENIDPAKVITVSVNGPELSADTGSTVMGLEPGDRLSMLDLLYGLLLPSGSDAAIEIAKQVSGSVAAFAGLMNARAAQLGLADTHFTNPHGLDDPGLYASADDLAELAAALLREPQLAEIVGTKYYQPGWDGPVLKNLNLLLGSYPGVVGVKTGFTDQAKQTIAAAVDRDGRRIIVTILGSDDMYTEAGALIEWALAETEPACAGSRPVRLPD
jgi:D-alanyl-D-alanine carboxypeptidase